MKTKVEWGVSYYRVIVGLLVGWNDNDIEFDDDLFENLMNIKLIGLIGLL